MGDQLREQLSPPRGAKAIRAAIDALPISDLGIAQRLILEHGHELQYVPEWKIWMIWDGRRWRRDTDGEIIRRAKRTVRGLAEEIEAGRR